MEKETYLLTPPTEVDKEQFIRIHDSLRNFTASLNKEYQISLIKNDKLSTKQFTSLPGNTVFTERQLSVIRVRITELWQQAMLQSILQNEPLVFTRDEFSQFPERIDMRTSSKEEPHVSLIYFNEEFTLEEAGSDKYKITLNHSPKNINPTGIINAEREINGIIGVELIINKKDEYIIRLVDDGDDNNEKNDDCFWWIDGIYEENKNTNFDELNKRLLNNSFKENPEIFNEAIKFIKTEEITNNERVDEALPDIFRILMVYNGIYDTAEFTNHKSILRRSIIEHLGLQTYETKNNFLNCIVYNENADLERLKAFDNAVMKSENKLEKQRLVAWMTSTPDDAITYTMKYDSPSEQNLVDIMSKMKNDNYRNEEIIFLLLNTHHYDSSTTEGIEKGIKRGKEKYEALRKFDKQYGTETIKTILIPTVAFRAEVESTEQLENFFLFDTEPPSSKNNNFWRL